MIIGYKQDGTKYLIFEYNKKNLIDFSNLIDFLNKCWKPSFTGKCLGRSSFQMKVGDEIHHVCYNEDDIKIYGLQYRINDNLNNPNNIIPFGSIFNKVKFNTYTNKPISNNSSTQETETKT